MTPFRFQPADFGPVVAVRLAEPWLMPLGPGAPVAAVRARLEEVELPATCRAGL